MDASLSPCKGKSFKRIRQFTKLLPLQGALLCWLLLYPGRCPGLGVFGPSARTWTTCETSINYTSRKCNSANWGNKKQPTEEIKFSQLRKQKVANWGNKIRPTEEIKSGQLRKCRKNSIFAHVIKYLKRWCLCSSYRVLERLRQGLFYFLPGNGTKLHQRCVWTRKVKIIKLN